MNTITNAISVCLFFGSSMSYANSVDDWNKEHNLHVEQNKQIVLPVVNDEHCKLENIKKIEDTDARQKFADLCFRRGEFVKSSGRVW